MRSRKRSSVNEADVAAASYVRRWVDHSRPQPSPAMRATSVRVALTRRISTAPADGCDRSSHTPTESVGDASLATGYGASARHSPVPCHVRSSELDVASHRVAPATVAGVRGLLIPDIPIAHATTSSWYRIGDHFG